MLQFDNNWRFDSPCGVASAVEEGFRQLIDRICGQGHQKTILEHFKSHFAKAAAVSYYPSSNESWASSDLDTVMSEAAVNAPLFIEAFYDACEAIKSRYPEMEMPGARRINRILSDEDTGFQIDPPNLITTREYVPIAVPAQAPSLDAQAVEEVIETGREWDVFICHASEDKDDFVRPLAGGLEQRGLRVWFDESTLRVGDSLRESIDHGLNRSRFGIVVLSPHFFSKQWPQNELNGLATREAGGLKVILPVWHNITLEKVREASLILADRVATSSSKGLDRVIQELMQAIAPPVIESRPAASAGAPPEVPQQPAAGTNVSSGDPKLDKLAADYRKQVDGMAAPEEKWAVQHGGERISVVMFNPKNPGQGQGREINASNRDDLKSVMDSLRSEWADRAREDEEYAKALLDKCS